MRDNELTTNLKNLITIVDVFVIDFLVLQVKQLLVCLPMFIGGL